MAELQWGTPEDRRRKASPDLSSHADRLRANPGHWAVVAEGLTGSRTQASSMALGIRRSKYAAFKPVGAWEAKSSKDRVWARFIGEDGEYAEVESSTPSEAS